MKLNELSPGEGGTIIRIIAGDQKLKRRLRDMGIVKGETLVLEKVAPLGDPIEIRVKGYKLSLRKREAEQIEIEKLNKEAL